MCCECLLLPPVNKEADLLIGRQNRARKEIQVMIQVKEGRIWKCQLLPGKQDVRQQDMSIMVKSRILEMGLLKL